jgi:hypothetical protein
MHVGPLAIVLFVGGKARENWQRCQEKMTALPFLRGALETQTNKNKAINPCNLLFSRYYLEAPLRESVNMGYSGWLGSAGILQHPR